MDTAALVKDSTFSKWYSALATPKKKEMTITDLNQLAAIKTVSDALSDDLSRVDNILQNTLMHCSQCAGPGANHSGALLWGFYYPPRCNNNNILPINRVIKK
jgi:hypothetical protein